MNRTRLGVDATLGQSINDCDALVVVLGPVTLEEHEEHRKPEKLALLRQVLDLVLPFTLAVENDTFHVRWQVGDPRQRPKLATARLNSVLGVNGRIGDLAEAVLNG